VRKPEKDVVAHVEVLPPAGQLFLNYRRRVQRRFVRNLRQSSEWFIGGGCCEGQANAGTPQGTVWGWGKRNVRRRLLSALASASVPLMRRALPHSD
jgi:hypothetical protein